jgi:hypothetical protein
MKKESSSDAVKILERAIDLTLQKEYLNASKIAGHKGLLSADVLKESQKLFYKNTPGDNKKKLLISLAHCATSESYRIIEKYIKITGPELKDWAILALHECRAHLESDLFKEDSGFIATGLGGEGNKLRYCFIISPLDRKSFNKLYRNIINDKFITTCNRVGSVFEDVVFRKNYAKIKILVPMDVAVGYLIEEGIKECNEKEGFVKFFYYVTNVAEPSKKEIACFLKEAETYENR